MTVDDFARLERSRALCAAIAECDERDAMPILVAALDDLSAGFPEINFFTELRSQAEEWGEFAHVAELEVYFAAALKRLGRTPLGIAARKRLLVRLWESLPAQDRAAFLSRVDPEGRFRGRAAA